MFRPYFLNSLYTDESNAIQHNSQARNGQLDLSFHIYGKYMAEAFLNEHTHQKAFERMVRDIQTSSQVKTRFAVTGHITTDFFHMDLVDGVITYPDNRDDNLENRNSAKAKSKHQKIQETEDNNERFDEDCNFYLKLGVTRTDKRIDIVDKLSLTEIDTHTFSSFKIEILGQTEIGDFDEKNNSDHEAWIRKVPNGKTGEIVFLEYEEDFFYPFKSTRDLQIGEAWMVDKGELVKFRPKKSTKGLDNSQDVSDTEVVLVPYLAPLTPAPRIENTELIDGVFEEVRDEFEQTVGKFESSESNGEQFGNLVTRDLNLIVLFVTAVLGAIFGAKVIILYQNRLDDNKIVRWLGGQFLPKEAETIAKQASRSRSQSSCEPQESSEDDVVTPTFDTNEDGEVVVDAQVQINQKLAPLKFEKLENSEKIFGKLTPNLNIGPPSFSSRNRQISTSSNPTPQTVSRFNQEWKPISILGAGGFGIVFKATNQLTDEERAIKRIQLPESSSKSTEDLYKNKFIREAKANAKMNHPNITRYFACWVEKSFVIDQKEQDKIYYEELEKTEGDAGGDGFDMAVREALGIEDDFENDSEELMFHKLSTEGIEETTSENSDFEKSTPKLENQVKNGVLDAKITKNSENDFLNIARKPSVNNSSLMLPISSSNSIIIFGAEKNNNKNLRYRKDSVRTVRPEVSSSEESQILTDSDMSSDVDSEDTNYWKNSSSEGSTSESTTQEDRKSEHAQKSEKSEKSTNGEITPKIEINDVSQKENINPADSILGNTRNIQKINQNQETNYLFIVMEFCSGGSLRSWLDDRSFFKINLHETKHSGWNYYQCHNYLVQICEAVSYLHKQRCIHRDIKPGNIMFDGKPRANAKNQTLIKLCDFGLSRQDADDWTTSPGSDMSKSELNKSLTRYGGVPKVATNSLNLSRYHSNAHIRLPSMVDITKGVGTKLYMAPELLQYPELMSKSGSWSKNNGCTGAVDIYAIGLVAIEMFSDFNTRIERMIILEGVKHSGINSVKNYRKGMGDGEENTIWRFPDLAVLVGRMLDRNPKMRPNARKIQMVNIRFSSVTNKVENPDRY